MISDSIYPVYVLVKFLAYIAWCYCGVRLFRQVISLKSAVAFGFVRLFLGVGFGIAIFFVGGAAHLDVPAHPFTTYVLIYAPVRYLEWSILAALLLSGGRAGRALLNGATQLWILCGIVVSHVADLPIILFTYEGAKGFLPVGLFLC